MLRYITLYITIVVFLVLFPAFAQAFGQVGVFVLHSNQVVKKACVETSAQTISGRDLLENAGLNPVFDNGFLVELDGEKSQSAWQNRGGNDFWYSYVFDNGSWQTVNSGASTFKLKTSQVYGWQNYAGLSILPNITFDSVCPPKLLPVTAPQASISSEAGQGNEPVAELPSKTPPPIPLKTAITTSSTQSPELSDISTPSNNPGGKSTVLSASISKPNNFYYILILLVVLGALGGYLFTHRKG